VEVSTCQEEGGEVVWVRGWVGEGKFKGDSKEDVVREEVQHGVYPFGGRGGWVERVIRPSEVRGVI
jgi:hypothetical protein